MPIIVGVEDQLSEIEFSVYPNPAQNSLNIRYDSPVNGEAIATIHDLSGQVIAIQSFGTLLQGEQDLKIDINGVPTGMYLLELQQGNIQMNTKIQIIH